MRNLCFLLVMLNMLLFETEADISSDKSVNVDIYSEKGKDQPPDICPDVLGFNCVTSPSSSTPTSIPEHASTPDFITTLSHRGGYTQILYLLAKSGLVDTLLNAQNMTLFLPNDDAMSRLSPQYINDISMDHTALVDLLSYHTCLRQKERVGRADNDKVLISINDRPIRLNRYFDMTFAAEGIKITDRNIQVNNGYVHGIDGIMTAPTRNIVGAISERPELSTLISLMTKAGLMEGINDDKNLTMFAPSDSAFDKLDPQVMTYLRHNIDDLKDVLRYHEYTQRTMYSIGLRHSQYLKADDGLILMIFQEGNSTSVNNARITEADISATNGVMHVIDHVLIPTRILLKIEASTNVAFG